MGPRNVTAVLNVNAVQDELSVQIAFSQTNTTPSSAAVPLFTKVTLAIGDNTVAVPAQAAGVAIAPPIDSVNPKLLKGVTGDTGVPFGYLVSGQGILQVAPLIWSFPKTSMSQFVIHSQVVEDINLVWL